MWLTKWLARLERQTPWIGVLGLNLATMPYGGNDHWRWNRSLANTDGGPTSSIRSPMILLPISWSLFSLCDLRALFLQRWGIGW